MAVAMPILAVSKIRLSAGHQRARRYAATGQRHVGRHHHIAWTRPLGDPVVAASKPAETMTLTTIGSRDGRNPELATKVTFIPCRSATLRSPA